MQALWGFDFDRERRRRSADEMILFAIIRDAGLLDRISNWPDLLRLAASQNKGRPLRAALVPPEQRLASVQAMSGGDAALLKRLLKIWKKAKPMPARIQSDSEVVWSDPEYGELHFRSVISVANEQDLLTFRDWHPVNADTWRALEKMKTRARRRPTR